MPGPISRNARERNRRAKATLDFATGEVHDRLVDAEAAEPEAETPAVGPGQLSNEGRAQRGIDTRDRDRARRERAANPKSQRRWVKARKIP